MPTYAWECSCGKTAETISPIAERNDHPPQCHGSMQRIITASYAVPDIAPYMAVTGDKAGQEISGRVAHREFLKRNRLIELGNEKLVNGTPDFRPARGAIREELRRVIPQVLQRYRN